MVSTPLKNMKVSWDYYSQSMESHKIHVPNHQPVFLDMSQLRNGTVSLSRPPGIHHWDAPLLARLTCRTCRPKDPTGCWVPKSPRISAPQDPHGWNPWRTQPPTCNWDASAEVKSWGNSLRIPGGALPCITYIYHKVVSLKTMGKTPLKLQMVSVVSLWTWQFWGDFSRCSSQWIGVQQNSSKETMGFCQKWQLLTHQQTPNESGELTVDPPTGVHPRSSGL